MRVEHPQDVFVPKRAVRVALVPHGLRDIPANWRQPQAVVGDEAVGAQGRQVSPERADFSGLHRQEVDGQARFVTFVNRGQGVDTEQGIAGLERPLGCRPLTEAP